MTPQHPDLAAGRWATLPLVEKMAHIGSEVERAINWNHRHNREFSHRAFVRALELIDLTLDSERTFPRLKEIARLREMVVDYFAGENAYHSTDVQWRKYFMAFAYAARRGR